MRYFILTVLIGLGANLVSAQSVHNDSTAIMEQFERWIQFARAENAEAVANIYTEDAMLIPPQAPPVSGRSVIQELFAKQYANSETSFTFQTHELKIAEDWAYRRGSYHLTFIINDGEEFQREADFIDIWQKGSDGKWRIARDIWNYTQPYEYE